MAMSSQTSIRVLQFVKLTQTYIYLNTTNGTAETPGKDASAETRLNVNSCSKKA